MDARRLGALLVVAGLVTIAVGTWGALSTGALPTTTEAPTESPTATASATASIEPSAEPTPVPTPTASPTPDPAALTRAFFVDLVAATRAGNIVSMLPRLHPAVIDRYGEAACQENLSTRAADATYEILVRSVGDPAPWDYVTDGLTTTIPGTWTVQADVTSAGTTEARELHVTPVDGGVRWFTDCGEPLAP